MYSLYRTLAVRFSLTMFLALVLIGAGAFFAVRQTVRVLMDGGLRSALELESDVLAAGLAVARNSQAHDLTAFVGSVNRFVGVRDSHGTLVAANTPLAFDLPLDETTFARALNGQRGWTTDTWAHGRVRSLYAPAPAGSQPDFAVIQVAASLGPLGRTQRHLLFVMVGIVVLATGATAVGARWLAKSAVAPITAITHQAAAIAPGNPGKRISAHADTVEFHELVGVLNSTLERQDRALDAQRRIIADIGHEFRTPLTALQGGLEIALRSPRAPELYREILESSLEEVEHLNSINETLLLLARLDAGHDGASHMPCNLSEIVERCVARARQGDANRNFELTSTCPTTLVAADAKLVELAVDQLLDNTREHTPSGTHVKATVDCNASQFVVAIEDDGPGIPADDLPHLFDRFFVRDPARTRTTGAGLGLSIAAAVAAAHNGSVTAELGSAGGLRVTVQFPIA